MIDPALFAEHEANYKAKIMHSTWGHLAPEPRRKYQGTILFAFGEYGDVVPIATDFKDLPDSPWFFDQMQEFIWTNRGDERGHVHRFTGTYMMFKNGKCRFSGQIEELL